MKNRVSPSKMLAEVGKNKLKVTVLATKCLVNYC